MKLNLTVLGIFLVICFDVHGQEIDFFKEDIIFHLSEKYFAVDGYYYFHNLTSTKVKRLIFYPIQEANDNGIIDSVSIVDVNRCTAEQIIKITKNGIYFELALEANDTSIYHIAYRQKISGHRVSYVLQTTQAWKRPLQIAEYKLVVENPVVIEQISYEADSVYQTQGMRIFLWRKENFFPAKDMTIDFSIH